MECREELAKSKPLTVSCNMHGSNHSNVKECRDGSNVKRFVAMTVRKMHNICRKTGDDFLCPSG